VSRGAAAGRRPAPSLPAKRRLKGRTRPNLLPRNVRASFEICLPNWAEVGVRSVAISIIRPELRHIHGNRSSPSVLGGKTTVALSYTAFSLGTVGQTDQAVTWLVQAYEEHDQWMVFANSCSGLDRLRSEPRFQALLRRMNFPQ